MSDYIELIDNFDENEISRDILVLLMNSRDSFVRGMAVERLSNFNNNIFNDSVFSSVIEMARKDSNTVNRAWALDFMASHPHQAFIDFLSEHDDLMFTTKKKCQAAYVHAIYRNLADSAMARLERLSEMTKEPELAAAALLSLSYLRDKFDFRLIEYLSCKNFSARLIVAAHIGEAIGEKDTFEDVNRVKISVKERVDKEKYDRIKHGLVKSLHIIDGIESKICKATAS